jgi:lipoate-protein ligase A
MRLIDNKGADDPAVNLALEEYCYRKLDFGHDYVLFYINRPSIIIGNHQNPFQEVNFDIAVRQKIRPVRRISGGGTVYHDPGNLNFSFITAFNGEMLGYFKRLLQPVLKTLQRLGVAAKLTDKNNITVEGRKISGNSQHTDMRRMLSHGTLLFDARLDILHRLLESRLEIIHSRAISSIRSRVTNISDHLRRPLDLPGFLTELTAAVSEAFGRLPVCRLTAGDWTAVHRLAEEKYRSWEWTYGRTPEFSAIHRFKFDADDVCGRILVRRGIIADIQFPAHRARPAEIRRCRQEAIGQRFGAAYTDQF